MNNNPFAVVSPEELTASQANQLFVEMHSDYPEITREGNTLITGARGCGKSMMIRCSLPDFLMVRNDISFSNLPYLSICVPIRKTSLNLQELRKLDNLHVPYMINEHFLALHVLMFACYQLSKIQYESDLYDKTQYKAFFENTYQKLMRVSGYKDDIDVDYSSPNTFFDSLYDNLFLQSCEFVNYLRTIIESDEDKTTYKLPLLSFTRFIVPVFKKLITLPCFPTGKPILIFIDDADNLSEIQTQILNTWLSSRTQPTISLKVSSQIGLYKTYLTSTGVLVESPHDYQETNISFLYTSRYNNNNSFYNKAIQILIRRLKIQGYATDVDVSKKEEIEKYLNMFFPSYKKQVEGIKKEEEKIRVAYDTDGRGFRESDDVRRYAIPNYIRGLGGSRKSRSTYRYAGLENIIHLSSGIIRYLLDAVAKMYDDEYNKLDKGTSCPRVERISTETQNSVMRDKADFYLFNEIKKSKNLEKDSLIQTSSNPESTTDRLANLINAMGKTFHEILVSGDPNDPFSGRSERKVFSIALTNPSQMNEETKQVFDLGVRLGFFHESYIGNKAGTGRTNLYILNRCFAPIFTLDPTGFQGYLFLTNEDLLKAIYNGRQLKNINVKDKNNDVYQLSLEDYWEDDI